MDHESKDTGDNNNNKEAMDDKQDDAISIYQSKSKANEENSQLVEEEEANAKKNQNEEEVINIMKIFKKFKCSRIILSYLRLSHIVSLSFLSKSLCKTVNKYFGDCINLDLSEYYGVIESAEFDRRSFLRDFLPKFKSVQSLCLRYCSHLKAVHLDNIIKALTTKNSSKDKEEEANDNN